MTGKKFSYCFFPTWLLSIKLSMGGVKKHILGFKLHVVSKEWDICTLDTDFWPSAICNVLIQRWQPLNTAYLALPVSSNHILLRSHFHLYNQVYSLSVHWRWSPHHFLMLQKSFGHLQDFSEDIRAFTKPYGVTWCMGIAKSGLESVFEHLVKGHSWPGSTGESNSLVQPKGGGTRLSKPHLRAGCYKGGFPTQRSCFLEGLAGSDPWER